jgi:hypothetical protein
MADELQRQEQETRDNFVKRVQYKEDELKRREEVVSHFSPIPRQEWDCRRICD